MHFVHKFMRNVHVVEIFSHQRPEGRSTPQAGLIRVGFVWDKIMHNIKKKRETHMAFT